MSKKEELQHENELLRDMAEELRSAVESAQKTAHGFREVAEQANLSDYSLTRLSLYLLEQGDTETLQNILRDRLERWEEAAPFMYSRYLMKQMDA